MIKKELEKIVETDFDKLIINHMKTVASVVQKFSLSQKVKAIAYESALLHDLGKFKAIKKFFFEDCENKNNYRLSLLHSVAGAAYLQQCKNNIVSIVSYPESVIKVIACHSPYYLTDEELKDLKECTLPYPLPRLDSDNDVQDYVLGKINLKVKKLTEEERLAAKTLILADHSVIHDKYTGVDSRLENIFTRYSDVLSENGKSIYRQRIKEIEKIIKIGQ